MHYVLHEKKILCLRLCSDSVGCDSDGSVFSGNRGGGGGDDGGGDEPVGTVETVVASTVATLNKRSNFLIFVFKEAISFIVLKQSLKLAIS